MTVPGVIPEPKTCYSSISLPPVMSLRASISDGEKYIVLEKTGI